MQRIELSQGKYALVDDDDFEWLSQWKWFAIMSRRTFYAVRNSPAKKGGQYTILMHREILGLDRGDKRQGDHANHDGLDNQKSNIRACTQSQNQANYAKRQNTSSQYKGARLHKCGLWESNIRKNNKRIFLGYFKTEIGAAMAYNRSALELFGEFANINILRS